MPQGTILWVDNDPGYVQPFADYLRDSGYAVEIAPTPEKALHMTASKAFDLALIDLVMPHGEEMSASETYGSTRTGLVLASKFRAAFPSMKLIGVSVRPSDEVTEWFQDFGHGFWLKNEIRRPREVLRRVNVALGHDRPIRRVFIVHGHDDIAKLSLKNLLQNSFSLSEPIILHERPSAGRTIIEKFEEESLESDLVFVLLTPDDPGMPAPNADPERRRSRQNVIFELGYFYGRLGRRSGKIFLLHKGTLDLPSDISGVVYIDISNGIDGASEQIRREVARFL